MVWLNKQARDATGLAGQEGSRLHHNYWGPEHLLLGLLAHGDNPAARLLRTHGLDLEIVRAEVAQLIAHRVLPGPQPSDDELLASVGVDLRGVRRRLKETFGDAAVRQAVERVSLRPGNAEPHPPMGGRALTARRALVLAAREARAREQEIGPLHLLLGLLRDASDPAGTDLHPNERREHAYLDLPLDGPHPVRLLIEARGVSLEALEAAVLSELDQDQ